MIWRALAIWLIILVLANLNGAARQIWLIPQVGEPVGRAVSTVALSALIFLVTWLTIGWIRPATTTEAMKIGGLWLALTLAFEFLVGHYVFRQPWATLVEDYDVTRGRIWVLVPVVVLLAPLWAARVRGLLQHATW